MEQDMCLKKSLIVALLATAAFASQEDHERYDGPEMVTYGLEDVFINFIEGLRQQLKQGIPDKNIPPLDPLDIKHQILDLKYKDDLKLEGLLANVTGNNILSFNVTKLTASMMPISFEVKLQWDPINIQGLYDIDGHLFSLVPIYGDGSFRGEFDGVFGYLRVDIGGKFGQLRVKKLEVDFGLRNIFVNATNFLGGTLGDIVCEIINENLPTMTEQFKIGYLEGIKQEVMKVINDFIKDMSTEDLIEWITGMFLTSTAPTSTASYSTDVSHD